MRAVVQRVKQTTLSVDEKLISSIPFGLCVFLGVTHEDEQKDADFLVKKIAALRIFEDENGKMNLSLMDIEGELLIVPNFTLYGDARKGRRPGYSGGAAPEIATELFDKLCAKAQTLGIKKVATGVFQADMKVARVNDGPVTLLLDSEKLF